MAPSLSSSSVADIFDIRQGSIQSSIKDDILDGLRRPAGEKAIPSMVLYEEVGLQLFEKITYLDQYYLTNTEIGVLEAYSHHLAEHIPNNSIILELGSGNLRKVRILLDAVERAQKDVAYYALDLDLHELERTLGQIPKHHYRHVSCRGLHGTFDDGMRWLKEPEQTSVPKCVMFLGSSIGNFSRQEAAAFLAALAGSLDPADSLLIGIDNCQDGPKVHAAYNDSQGVTREFYRTGLLAANRLIGFDLFCFPQWDIVGSYDERDGRHVATVSPRDSVDTQGLHFDAGEHIRFEWSHKYSIKQQRQLFEAAGLQPRASYSNAACDYSLSMLAIPASKFSLEPKVYAKEPVPSLDEWNQLWSAWDLVSRSMIPEKELLSKPINLRNCCLFYLGHIPTFLDIHISRATGQPRTEPASYGQIFERGIDPDVENPSLCHAHSEIPEEWPELDEILSYGQRVRERAAKLYEDGTASDSPVTGHALWLAFEHEALHLETLLYMLLQGEKMLPPPGPQPDFPNLAKQSRAAAKPQSWVAVPARTIAVGMNGPDSGSKGGYYGWDNEKPARQQDVAAFEASTRPITNGDYAEYLESGVTQKIPASWGTRVAPDLAHANGRSSGPSASFISDKTVKTIYGPVPLAYALDWPLMASYDEIAAYANWKGGRVPALEEARSIYAYVEEMDNALSSNITKTIPAVNGHLSNDGVEETPPLRGLVNGNGTPGKTKPGDATDPTRFFADLSGCNVGFHAFHPLPVSLLGDAQGKLTGRAGLGGVWEWTSTTLEPHAGFQPMEEYPGYTADFFDGKHNVVLGGSWATHPRIAGRKSFVNWYQRNYPYAWCGARLVRDLAN